MRASEYENKLKQQAEMIGRQGERIEQLEAEIGGLKKLLVGKAEAFASLTNAVLTVLRLLHPPGQPLRATAERIQWRPASVLSRLGLNPSR